MLNWEEIACRIDKPILCEQNEIQDLKEFCVKFPYSQVFPLLYLKVLSKGNHLNFEEELEKYAYKITDRVQLYNLLHQKEEEISVVEVESESKEVKIHLTKLEEGEISNNKINSKLEQEITEVNPEGNFQNEFEHKEIIQDKQSELIIDELDKEILASSAVSAFVLDEIEQVSAELPEFDLSLNDNINNIELELEIIPDKFDNQIDVQEKTFLEWLTKSINSEINELQEEDKVSYEVSYIEFEKPKKEFFSPIKKAKESLSEETLPVSETLAKIYQAQGNISKAIYVYQQLSLIIPEKKSYFATQIKSLKKKIN